MSKSRTPIGAFIHSRWTTMNVRCGGNGLYYTPSKRNLLYANVYICFSRDEFKAWCLARKEEILRLSRPTIDRLDKSKDYLLSNIQVIELADNVAKDKLTIFLTLGYGVCGTCQQEVALEHLVKSSRSGTGYINKCRPCERRRIRRNRKQAHIEVRSV